MTRSLWNTQCPQRRPPNLKILYPLRLPPGPNTPQLEQEPDVPSAVDSNSVKFALPPPYVPEDIDLSDEGAPRRYRLVQDCVDTSEPTELDLDELLLAASEESNTFEQAKGDPAWRTAMQEEMNSIVNNRTWSLATLPSGHRPIGLKWGWWSVTKPAW